MNDLNKTNDIYVHFRITIKNKMDSSDDEIFKSTISQIPTDKSNNLINELETSTATINTKVKNPSENTAENNSLATSSETIVNNQPKSGINSNSNKTSIAQNTSNSLSYIDDSFKNFQQKYFVEVKNLDIFFMCLGCFKEKYKQRKGIY